MDKFLVCGLGSLGQHCVSILKQFGVQVSGIDLEPRRYWDVDGLPDLVEELIVGDCREPALLEKCGIQGFRSILLVTDDERVNIEAAFVARLKNPRIRLVIRSAQKNLNELLSQQLENFAAFEPTEISSTTFALAALGDEMRGSFYLNGRLVQVLERDIKKNDPFLSRSVGDINKHHPVLAHGAKSDTGGRAFYQWQAERRIVEGDHLLFLNVVDRPKGLRTGPRSSETEREPSPGANVSWRDRLSGWKETVSRTLHSLFSARSLSPFWQNRLWRLVGFCLSLVVILLSIGSVLFYLYGPGLNPIDAVYAAVTLMLGGYFDLLGNEFKFDLPIPWWLRLFGLLQTLTGTVLIGALYALITSHILATSFNFTKRPRFPDRGHIIVIGWGRIGQRVTGILTELRRPFLVITKDDPQAPPHMPILTGVDDTGAALSRVSVKGAKAIVAVTNEEMINLELGLTARRINPSCRLVIRTYHHRFGSYVRSLFPYAQVLSSSVFSAEAFAAAAFGENVLNLFIQNGRTILVTQYTVEAEDTLNGRLLAEVAFGYQAVPILLAQMRSQKTIWMPSHHIRLGTGDELTVLATIDTLRRIERGERTPPTWELAIHRVSSPWAKTEGMMVIARTTGCTPGESRRLLDNLPGRFPGRLYRQQAEPLLHKLRKMGFEADLIPRGET
jgi:Trk K+ transport system NAD-binding subunit